MIQSLRLIAAAALAPLALGCTAMQGGARLEDWRPDPGPLPHQPVFTGLLLGPQQPADDITRYVFNIHGMGRTEDSYNNSMAEWLTTEFGYAPVRNAHGATTDGWVHVGLESKHFVSGEGIVCVPNTSRPEEPHPDDQAAEPLPTSPDLLQGAIDCRYSTFGRYRVERFQRTHPSGVAERLIVYTYFWHEDLWRIQAPYMDDDIGRDRAVINSFLKRSVVDEGFSDAAAYLGTMRPIVIDGVRGALCAMLTEAATDQPVTTQPMRFWRGRQWVSERRTSRTAPAGAACFGRIDPLQIPLDADFNFVSHSLGSRMLLDALAPYTITHTEAELRLPEEQRPSPTRVIQGVAQRTRTLFMAANQIPLFGVGSVDIQTTAAALAQTPAQIVVQPNATAQPNQASTSVAAITGVSTAGDGAAGECRGLSFFDCVPPPPPTLPTAPQIRLDVVGFLDPDDILGFEANSGMLGVAPGGSAPDHNLSRARYFTVVNRNTSQWLWLLTWPTNAHDREMHNRSSVDLIFCGARVRGERLVARTSRNQHGCETEDPPAAVAALN